MAGDWIKMRKELLTSPKVVRIMSACDADRFRTIGGLFAVWCLFDEQTKDGILDAYTPKVLDSIVGFAGLAEAMVEVGWLETDEKGRLIAVNFKEHNGKTAKRRAAENVRKMSARMSASDADKLRPKRREEKRRSKKENPQPPLDVPDELKSICQDWLDYKRQRKEVYVPKGFEQFCGDVRKVAAAHGADEVRRRMQSAMANNYQGWNFEPKAGSGSSGGKTWAQQTQSNVQQLLVKAAADDAAAGRASGLAGFLGGSDGN